MQEIEIYAKSYNNGQVETLEEHTENLLKELERLKDLYKNDINKIGINERFWMLLRYAIIFHDLGKVSTHFQNKIRIRAGKNKLPIDKNLRYEIPHNLLSPAFMFSLLKELSEDEFFMVLYAVTFHHNKELSELKRDFLDDEYLAKYVEKDLKPKIGYLRWVEKYGIRIENVYPDYLELIEDYPSYEKKIPEISNNLKTFILLKGLLHRIDHSASAHLPVEEEKITNAEEYLLKYIRNEKKSTDLKPFQKEVEKYRDKSILFIGSTGIGKTEFAMNWIGNNKAFYTLPVRVSVDAMYERFKKVYGEEKVGILYSDSYFYIFENSESKVFDSGLEEHLYRVDLSKQLAMPITISTADQLFTFALKHPNYEKIHSTLMYSKVVLDEPQSYSPETLAIIIKGLQEVTKYGGKFCFMSATIHPFVERELKDYYEKLPIVFNPEKKHKISLKDKPLDELTDSILTEFKKDKKVLVITNTVRKAEEIYKNLKDKGNIKLLHSLFIKKHRKKKENEIQKEKNPVIWISTQLVEASLDIDYDILFTEISTLDSLIQRMGRVYRKKGKVVKESDDPNVIISITEPSDNGEIYNKDIVDITIKELSAYNDKILSDKDKQDLMLKVFDVKKIKNTNFYKKFKKNIDILNKGLRADTKSDAQNIFRKIYNVNVIPLSIYESNKDKIKKWIDIILDKNTDKGKKIEYLYKLNNLTTSIPYWRIKDKTPIELIIIRGGIFIFIVDLKYDEEIGLDLTDIDNNEFDNYYI